MAQFTTGQPVRRERGVVATTDEARTAQGGPGFKRDSRSELFMTAVTHLHGKDTFYEAADTRAQRFVGLVQNVAKYDPVWLANFIPWLRDEAGIRTATVVAAVEYALADTDCHKMAMGGVITCTRHAEDAACQRTGWGRGVPSRAVVGGSFQRADEPAEALGYYLGRYGRRLPKGLKKGLSDAAINLYDQMTVLKYDSSRHTVRPSDVIALTHPKPVDAQQDAVFTALHDRRHGRKHRAETLAYLPLVLDDSLGESATWERSSGDGKANWDELIPRMGAFALLRNLRNFDRDGISQASVDQVKRRLSDPLQIQKARLFPLRFLSAWGALESMRWGETLEAGLQASLQNVPELKGHTLILWDCSGSMQSYESRYGQGKMDDLWRQAGVFSLALAQRAEKSTVIAYSNEGYDFPVNKGSSILRETEKVRKVRGLWSGTKTWYNCDMAIRRDPSISRVVVVTDEQEGTRGYREARVDFDAILGQRPCYILNVAGYEIGSAPSDRVVAFAGFNDRAFLAIQQAEAGLTGQWPWVRVD